MTPLPPNADCHATLEWLQPRLDGSSAPQPDDVAAHIADCAACRNRVLAADRLLHSAGDRAPRLPPSPLLTERIVAAVRHDARRRVARRWLVAGASLAAAIVFALWLRSNLAHRESEEAIAKAISLRTE